MTTAASAATSQQTSSPDGKFGTPPQLHPIASAVSTISTSSVRIVAVTASAAAQVNGRDLLHAYAAEPAMHRFFGPEFSNESLRKQHIQKMPLEAADATARSIATAVRKEAEEAQILEFEENRNLHFFNVIPLVKQMDTHLVHFFNYVKHKIPTEMLIWVRHVGETRIRQDVVVPLQHVVTLPQLNEKTVAEKAAAIRAWLINHQDPFFFNLSTITVRGLRALPREIGFFKPETLDLDHNALTHLPMSLPTPRRIYLAGNQFTTIPKVLFEERMRGLQVCFSDTQGLKPQL